VPAPIEKVFDFFSHTSHLEKIIPEQLSFKVLKQSTEKSGLGTRFQCQLVSHGFDIEWHGEITKWQPPYLFTDIMIKGPYAAYKHEHSFVAACKGTIIRDKVLYKMPLGAFGRLGGKWLAEKDQNEVFAGRRRAIAAIFANDGRNKS
jgi:ligand-binding SRPBCC domain-containing protein